MCKLAGSEASYPMAFRNTSVPETEMSRNVDQNGSLHGTGKRACSTYGSSLVFWLIPDSISTGIKRIKHFFHIALKLINNII